MNVEDYHCECGQYLTKYLIVIGQCRNWDSAAFDIRSVTLKGVPCPARGCDRTYAVQLTRDYGTRNEVTVIPRLELP